MRVLACIAAVLFAAAPLAAEEAKKPDAPVQASAKAAEKPDAPVQVLGKAAEKPAPPVFVVEMRS